MEDKVSSMARQMNQWVDKVLGPGFHRYCPSEAWVPAVNLYEYKTHYYLVVDLAGMRTEDIDLRVDEKKDVLIISGRRLSPGTPEVEPNVQLLLMEIDHGPFCRSIELPSDANPAKIHANYRNGFLWIRIPKA